MTKKIKTLIAAHKVISAIILLAVMGGGYGYYRSVTSTSGEVRYVTEMVQRGTVIASVTGTGQISASNQINLTPKVGGTVISVSVVAGQKVVAGQLIAQLDTTDARKAVRDAQINLDSAKLALAKIQEPADQLSITQAQNAIATANDAKQNAQSDLAQSYESGFNSVSNAFLNLPTIITGVQDAIYGMNASLTSVQQANVNYYMDSVSQYSDQAVQLKDDVTAKYQTARVAYDRTFADYKAVTRASDTKVIEAIIVETYATTRNIADAVKSINNLIQFYEDQLTERNLQPKAFATTQLTTLNGYTGQINTHLTDLLTVTNNIQSDKDAITSADRTITANNQSLQKLQAGADALDIQSAQLAVAQRQNALLDAQQNLVDYSIRAPFSGTIATLNINPANAVTTGMNVATLIAPQKVAEIALNEVDVAKVKQGDKATLTFDAIDGLNITGNVVEIDTVGTVTQGVVTYTVKISLDAQDDRVKPGMSTSAAIITGSKIDVIVVPNSAIKTQGTTSYVEVFNSPLPASTSTQGVASVVPPQRQAIVVGLSNDTDSEVLSGVNEGDQIVVKTITGTSQTAATQQAPSLFSTGGGNRSGAAAGAIRRATGD